MWQRFTESSRKVVFYAQEEARRLGHNIVSNEHFLYGLIRDRGNNANVILARLNISPEQIKEDLDRRVPRGSDRIGQDMELSQSCKDAVDAAYTEAQHLSVHHIGTEHLLFGLVAKPDGIIGEVFTVSGLNAEDVRDKVREISALGPEGNPELNLAKRSSTDV